MSFTVSGKDFIFSPTSVLISHSIFERERIEKSSLKDSMTLGNIPDISEISISTSLSLPLSNKERIFSLTLSVMNPTNFSMSLERTGFMARLAARRAGPGSF